MSDLRQTHERLHAMADALVARAEGLNAAEETALRQLMGGGNRRSAAGVTALQERLEALGKQADKYERRAQRCFRALSAVGGMEAKEQGKARTLAKSRKPQDRAELVLRAWAELPIEIQGEVLRQMQVQLTASAGGQLA